MSAIRPDGDRMADMLQGPLSAKAAVPRHLRRDPTINPIRVLRRPARENRMIERHFLPSS
jgi:hypothetical protein